MSGSAGGGGPAGAPLDLVLAYRDTDYCVDDGRGEVTLRIGDRSTLPAPVPGRVHAVLGAGNPRSRLLTREANRAADSALRTRLDADGLAWRPAVGRGRSGDWPPEPSLWIQDIDPGRLDALATACDQNACVVVDGDGRVRLRLYRPDWREHLPAHPDVQWP